MVGTEGSRPEDDARIMGASERGIKPQDGTTPTLYSSKHGTLRCAVDFHT